MSKQFPPEVRRLVSSPSVKKSFISDLKSPNPYDCKNCGGVGTLTVFLATKGPFQTPNPPSPEEVNKYEHPFGWWVGSHCSVTCPVCDGIGRAI